MGKWILYITPVSLLFISCDFFLYLFSQMHWESSTYTKMFWLFSSFCFSIAHFNSHTCVFNYLIDFIWVINTAFIPFCCSNKGMKIMITLASYMKTEREFPPMEPTDLLLTLKNSLGHKHTAEKAEVSTYFWQHCAQEIHFSLLESCFWGLFL